MRVRYVPCCLPSNALPPYLYVNDPSISRNSRLGIYLHGGSCYLLSAGATLFAIPIPKPGILGTIMARGGVGPGGAGGERGVGDGRVAMGRLDTIDIGDGRDMVRVMDCAMGRVRVGVTRVGIAPIGVIRIGPTILALVVPDRQGVNIGNETLVGLVEVGLVVIGRALPVRLTTA